MAKSNQKAEARGEFDVATKGVMPVSKVTQTIKTTREEYPQPLNNNERQRNYIDALVSGKPLVVGEGPAGTGKTYIPSVVAAKQLIDGKIGQIVITSPAVGAGKTLGYDKGDPFEKMEGWAAPILDTLVDIFDKATIRGMYDNNILKLIPFEKLRGRSFERAFIFADECQNLTVEQMKLFLTRSQDSSQTVLMGDLGQIDIAHKGDKNGFQDLKTRLEKYPDNELVSITSFLPEDVVRSPLCEYIVDIYSEKPSRAIDMTRKIQNVPVRG